MQTGSCGVLHRSYKESPVVSGMANDNGARRAASSTRGVPQVESRIVSERCSDHATVSASPSPATGGRRPEPDSLREQRLDMRLRRVGAALARLDYRTRVAVL